jgi:hypothetical protein
MVCPSERASHGPPHSILLNVAAPGQGDGVNADGLAELSAR